MKGGVPVQEGSRKGLGRGPGRGFPIREGGGVLVQEGDSWGLPGMVPVQEGGGGFLCMKGGGSYVGRGFLGGSWDGSCAGRGGGA